MTSNDPTTDAETYNGYSIDDEDQPGAGEGLGDSDVEDELDRGYSPPERYSAAQGYGNTPWEEAHPRPLEDRLKEEEPEPDPLAEAEAVDDDGLTHEADLPGTEVGDQRAGRLVDPDEGLGADTEKDLVAGDVGIDGAAASAEEAAMHVIDEGDDAGLTEE
ncbi:hypothetical protein JK386_07315 [Nocardioides sp. zg-536]|uniref:DUF5709 domain-containing protein n=1 Tax=Nocardioides faecalis TaxID=2803858 RepID=A0A938Y482_9ACTN|nr:DUF5709 domain-containing protein [Nocardioides faecalis]MBM9459708.1 hypothetical protein [Nocardioides faecalis]QVI58227.1 hypothetical protein KG111_14610 [Nocardioides faecalis]